MHCKVVVCIAIERVNIRVSFRSKRRAMPSVVVVMLCCADIVHQPEPLTMTAKVLHIYTQPHSRV